MAPTYFGLRPLPGSLRLSLGEVILILNMLPHHRITNYDVTLLNVLISI